MKISEMLLWILGTGLLAVYAGHRYWGEHQRLDGVEDFAAIGQLAPYEWLRSAHAEEEALASASSDTRDQATPDAVIALLRIPAIGMEVPVYQGTTEHVLGLGAGLVEGTALPGSATGNVGIVAHRDTHFQGLKDVVIGDVIELGTPGQVQSYRVTALEVVAPGDVQVLDDTREATLTLVTCYPFYFVGPAPQRYVVRATAAGGPASGRRT